MKVYLMHKRSARLVVFLCLNLHLDLTSEYRTCLVFERSKPDQLRNGLDFECHLKTQQFCVLLRGDLPIPEGRGVPLGCLHRLLTCWNLNTNHLNIGPVHKKTRWHSFQLTFKYSGYLKSRCVRISNGRPWSVFQMVRLMNGFGKMLAILSGFQMVQISNGKDQIYRYSIAKQWSLPFKILTI